MKKILLIEDEDQLARMYQIKLEADGFQVVRIKNGTKAIESISREKPDLVLLDLAMPKMSGLEVLEKMKSQSLLPSLPVLVITNSALKHYCQKAIALGAIDCLYKYHFTPTTLSQKIKEILS